MKTAAVSELKALLSEYLAGVKAGEEVIVTDRGKPIAKLIPISRGDNDIPGRLLILEKAGLVKIGSGRIPESFWKRPRIEDKKGLALKALLQDREEGK
ncbi:MAG: type II toxin-antitoxin system prevent-host-death family antitoxin [Deltaproteobacteria bacterium]|nr:type II toxin-antitoxin system prevent-host-death family antitoxin [Deltaproteobacteria bacterium]